MEGCTRSLVDMCRREQVLWDVTTCGWSEEEEQDRITRYHGCGFSVDVVLVLTKGWTPLLPQVSSDCSSAPLPVFLDQVVQLQGEVLSTVSGDTQPLEQEG